MMNKFIAEDYVSLPETAKNNKSTYKKGTPFENISFKNFFNLELLDKVLAEFPDLTTGEAMRFDKPKEKKLAGVGEYRFGDATREFMHFLNSQPFLEFLQELTGIKEILIGDPYFSGAGLHEIKRGGLLKVHADFNKHPMTGMDRRLNVLIYLNKDWKEEYGGHFELWDKEMTSCQKKVSPEFNTMAIFSTTDFSYHGHPDPLNCPEDRSRKSLALYYYSNGRPKEEINLKEASHNTLFKERQGSEEDKEAFNNPTLLKKISRMFSGRRSENK